jgi:Tfp pilus assembly protein PilV
MTDPRPAIRRRLWPRVLREEDGLSVIELVIASTLSMVILLSMLMMIDSGTRAERGQQARTEAMLDGRAAMQRITRDTRQALSLATSSNRTKIDMQTLVSGDVHHVTFELAGGTLIRRSCAELTATPSCALPTDGEPLAANVTAVNPGPPAVTSGVFCYDPPVCAAPAALVHARSVRISFGIDPEVLSGGPITLATDVKLRNI